jgi:cellulose biosynthesis protein BcsQ
MSIPVFVFVSGKGGVGKTTVSANYAQLMQEAGNTVVILDLDVFNRGATTLLLPRVGFERSAVTEYFDFRNDPDGYRSSFRGEDVFITVSQPVAANNARVLLFPASPPALNLTPLFSDYNLDLMAQFLSIIISFAEQSLGARAIIVDCGPTPDPMAMAAIRVASRVVIVTQADPVSFDGAKNLEFHIKANYPEYDIDNTFYIINKVPPEKFDSTDLSKMFTLIEHRVLSYIPYETRIAAVFGDIPFARELGFTTFESKIVVALRKLCEVDFPHLVPDEVKRLPPDVIDFYHTTLEVQKSYATQLTRLIGGLIGGIGFTALVTTIMVSTIGRAEWLENLTLNKDEIQLLSFVFIVFGGALFYLSRLIEKTGAARLVLSKRELGKTLLENKSTLKMLLAFMRVKT